MKEFLLWDHDGVRVLRVGGSLYLGVPNVLSLHNRLLGLVGVHPTCAKMISGHVRVFSKRDTIGFYEHVAGELVSVEGFYGSQFYPFPRVLAHRLASVMPTLAVSIFFLIKKTANYEGQFLRWLSEVGDDGLATNYLDRRGDLAGR